MAVPPPHYVSMDEILGWLERQYSLAQAKAPSKLLACVRITQTLLIKQMPFTQPSLILVLVGQATATQGAAICVANAGALLAIPAPAQVDMRLECDVGSGHYSALTIPLSVITLEQHVRTHALYTREPPRVLMFDANEALHVAIKRYLLALKDPRMHSHCLWEILSMLLHQNADLLRFSTTRARWTERVRAVLSRDLARGWDMDEIGGRLGVTANTLRKHLKEEGTTCRELVYELRLSTGLMQLLQTSLPIYRVAYDCGYQSAARFTQNFYKRFGVLPRAFREAESPPPPPRSPRRPHLPAH